MQIVSFSCHKTFSSRSNKFTFSAVITQEQLRYLESASFTASVIYNGMYLQSLEVSISNYSKGKLDRQKELYFRITPAQNTCAQHTNIDQHFKLGKSRKT